MKYIYPFFFILLVSCSQKANLDLALQSAGSNRPELEKVLDHYSASPSDSLKLRAAVFLIENMPYYFSYSGEDLEKIKEAMRWMKKDNEHIPDSIIRAANDFSTQSLRKVYDAQVITADYLIRHIDQCFRNWQERPWNRHLSFEEFAEWLLPYRVGLEPLEEWMEPYREKYATALDSLYQGTDPIEAANLLSLYLGQTEKITFNSDVQYINPGPLFYLDCISGSCLDLRDASIYILRAIGIPAMADFFRISPTEGNGMHTWVVIRDTTGRDVAFRSPGLEVSRSLPADYQKGKVYRKCHGLQPLSQDIITDPRIPSFFRSPFLRDVTESYSGKNRLEVEVAEKGHEYIYLGVHTSWRTMPIAMAKVRGRKAVFEDVEKGLVYQLLAAEGEQLSVAGYPVLFGEDSTRVFVPDTTRRQTLHLYRKYFLADWLYRYMNYMIDGTIEGAVDKHFQNQTFYYQLQDSIRNEIVKSYFPNPAEKTRYVRFSSPYNRRIDLAEVSFFTPEGQIPPAKIALSGGPSLNIYKNGLLQNISDGDPLTYYASADTSATVVFDLGEAASLTHIDILPRTDDNFIRPGDVYELHYQAGIEGWKSLGRQQATAWKGLIYDNVPTNALLWLQNHTRGKEEQVFYMDGEEQVFTGKKRVVNY
ncbi:hypothetical protein M2480_002143 [Parabacteroides sp. PFB2-12]|uniref:transglutaminase domain-containing protein n=1 Tax=unclassified Parabacteroides TaxID=2649774 RepID=UPI0024763EC3|nr:MULTISPECIES: transglutaminase domain-containing protein [unclassified Parabacteroides]MDH6342163.1 hypothetical protein [Parabacteroides sp. PM6-13]MDH6391153.1 hypothetical protein [Parabacteroides sp. PFB2-12]